MSLYDNKKYMKDIGDFLFYARRPSVVMTLLAFLALSIALFSCQADDMEDMDVGTNDKGKEEMVKSNSPEASPEVRQLSLLFIGSSFGVSFTIGGSL